MYKQKSKLTAYLLWGFLGAFGAHRFYTGNIGTGILWLCTLGLFGVGIIADLFLTSGLVDKANLMASMQMNAAQAQPVIVQVSQHVGDSSSAVTGNEQAL